MTYWKCLLCSQIECRKKIVFVLKHLKHNTLLNVFKDILYFINNVLLATSVVFISMRHNQVACLLALDLKDRIWIIISSNWRKWYVPPSNLKEWSSQIVCIDMILSDTENRAEIVFPCQRTFSPPAAYRCPCMSRKERILFSPPFTSIW